ncbi:expressed unknown protein [Seminavis robusta]|uniref:Uncharacterized protein n=1 Tax=Seminavis robusta TaxID=568900 RepID=A0A9N8H7M3_9STRA|nr:expressed unknown protein [Seminavis robusta]|eukprot:Sro144_g066960.1 n/a (696) ;mRNA; r:39635-41840
MAPSGSKKFWAKDDDFQWKTLQVPKLTGANPGDPSEDGQEDFQMMDVSNDQVPLPSGLTVCKDFLSQEEASNLYREIQCYEFSWEGFEQRRKVKRFMVPKEETKDNDCGSTTTSSTPIPHNLQLLIDRVGQSTGHFPQHVCVEEHNSLHTLKVTQYGSNGYNSVLTSFETLVQPESTSCFVAQIPLGGSAVQHLNKPKRRHPTCFDLESTQHWTDVRLDANTLLVKQDDCLWNWRSRVSAIPPPADNNKNQDTTTTFIILKLYTLPDDNTTSESSSFANNMPSMSRKDSSDGIDYDAFGYMGGVQPPIDSPMPPLQDILTIIVTTSPIPSNPSTDVIEKTFACFSQGGTEFAYHCRKVIVCDGVRTQDNGEEVVSRKHTNPKQAMRNGICNVEQTDRYQQYKQALRHLCTTAGPDSPFWNTDIEELPTRHGYGFALGHTLRECITTPYVCVIQHDRTIMRPTPIIETMRAMWHHRHIKYVTMSMRSNLMYKDYFIGKYGKTYHADFDDMILRLPQLCLDASLYGPDSHSTENITYNTPKVRESYQGLRKNYLMSKTYQGQHAWLQEHAHELEPGKHQLTLTPTLFWYDNVHIAETAHYRDFVFDPIYKMVKKGGFVEDKLSPVLTRTLEKLGLREGHSRFGCYLLDDHSGYFFTGHTDGGNYKTKAEKMALKEQSLQAEETVNGVEQSRRDNEAL